MTLRMGFGCILAPPDTYPIQTAAEDLGLRTLGAPWPPPTVTPDEWISRLGGLPLMHQPGSRWMYNTGIQVLGVLLERVVGRPLEQLLRERILEPLEMRDTGFSVREEQQPRFTTAYVPDQQTGVPTVLDSARDGYWAKPPVFPNASGWLVSSIDDYWKFVRMLRHGGVGDRRRVLSSQSIRLMTLDQLTEQQRLDAVPFVGPHSSWGFGMAVPANGFAAGGIPGGYGWDGGTGTTWRTDVDLDLTGILFTQPAIRLLRPPGDFQGFLASGLRPRRRLSAQCCGVRTDESPQ